MGRSRDGVMKGAVGYGHAAFGQQTLSLLRPTRTLVALREWFLYSSQNGSWPNADSRKSIASYTSPHSIYPPPDAQSPESWDEPSLLSPQLRLRREYLYVQSRRLITHEEANAARISCDRRIDRKS